MANTEMIKESEVMLKLEISSRQTLWNYVKKYNFPKPVRTHPKQYLRSEVDHWIINGGVNQRSS